MSSLLSLYFFPTFFTFYYPNTIHTNAGLPRTGYRHSVRQQSNHSSRMPKHADVSDKLHQTPQTPQDQYDTGHLTSVWHIGILSRRVHGSIVVGLFLHILHRDNLLFCMVLCTLSDGFNRTGYKVNLKAYLLPYLTYTCDTVCFSKKKEGRGRGGHPDAFVPVFGTNNLGPAISPILSING